MRTPILLGLSLLVSMNALAGSDCRTIEQDFDAAKLEKLGVDVRVGDVSIEGLHANIDLDLGVGDAEIRAKAADYGRVKGEAGVGDVYVAADTGDSHSERAVVSDSVSWVAAGKSSISADLGVGDAEITLD